MAKYFNSDVENAVIIDRESDSLEFVLIHLPNSQASFAVAALTQENPDDEPTGPQVEFSLAEARTLRDLLNSPAVSAYLG